MTSSSARASQVITPKSLNEMKDDVLFERVDAAIAAYFDADAARSPAVAAFVTNAIALRASNRARS